MVKKSASINLIKKDKGETISQIINWAQTVGRVLIITVQIITLSALVYRFFLDNELRSVHAKIKQEQVVLESLKKNENTYRNLQERLNLIASVSDIGAENVKVFKEIIGLAPVGMTFSSVTLTEDGIKIEANVSSIYPLSIFVNSLKKYEKIDTVSINKIENRTSSAVIIVSMTATLKKGAVNAASIAK
ncbi:MAG: hypothetical protein AAB702_02220 [Patescibacteria group bacterium]